MCHAVFHGPNALDTTSRWAHAHVHGAKRRAPASKSPPPRPPGRRDPPFPKHAHAGVPGTGPLHPGPHWSWQYRRTAAQHHDALINQFCHSLLASLAASPAFERTTQYVAVIDVTMKLRIHDLLTTCQHTSLDSAETFLDEKFFYIFMNPPIIDLCYTGCLRLDILTREWPHRRLLF